MQMADEAEVFSMLDGDKLRAAVKRHKPDFVVPEILAIRTEVLQEIEAAGTTVVPSARATMMTMKPHNISELAAETHSLRTSKLRFADGLAEVEAGAAPPRPHPRLHSGVALSSNDHEDAHN